MSCINHNDMLLEFMPGCMMNHSNPVEFLLKHLNHPKNKEDGLIALKDSTLSIDAQEWQIKQLV